MKWLYRIVSLLYGCRHRWHKIHTIRVFEFEGATKPCETKAVLECRKCGNLKSKRIG